MEAKIKINELEQVNQLTSTHLIVVQDGAVENAETKKATLSLLRAWLGSLNFEDLTDFLLAGEDISIDVDELTKTIKINSTAATNKWYAGTQPAAANEGDLWLNSQGEVYCYTNGSWSAAEISLKGPQGSDGQNGENGFSPVITVIENANGYTLKIQDKDKEQSINIVNGLVPQIDEETLCWVIGGINTGISAKGEKGLSPTAKVEKTEYGFTIIVNDGEESRVDITTPTIEIGTVETIPNGQTPVVENVGDNINAILNFKIPKGQDGGGSVVVQGPYTLTVDGWLADKTQFIALPLELTNRNVVDIDYESMDIWAAYQIRPFQETIEGIWFQYTIKPISELNFYVTSMGVNN